MSKTNVKREDKGDGADFINQQRAMDEALNKRIKDERPEEDEDVDLNRKSNFSSNDHKRDASEKETGRRSTN